MTTSVVERVIGDLKKAKHLVASQIGVALLIGGVIGYSGAAVGTQVHTVQRMAEKPGADDAELHRLRQQVKALHRLVERHREELVAMDGEVESLKGGSR